MIALSYGITYIWGTVGIILICKYLPSWWGIDAKAAAREYEREHGVASGDVPALTGWTAGGLRAYRLENDAWVGKTLVRSPAGAPRVPRRQSWRGTARRSAQTWRSPLKRGDIVALGGTREAMTEKMGLIGPEVSDRVALDVPLDQAEILVTNKELLKKTRERMARPAGRRSGPGRRPRARRRADPDRHRYQAAADGHPHGRRA